MFAIVKDDEWGLYPNFSKQEMACKHTGECRMTHKMMRLLQALRNAYNKPLIVSSGYRDVSHPAERDKTQGGEHTVGMAVDIRIAGTEAMLLIATAHGLGFRRIGMQQKGDYDLRFVHLGIGDKLESQRFPQALWSY